MHFARCCSVAVAVAIGLSWPLPAAQRESRPVSGYIDAGDDVRLFYRIEGSGTSSVVVLHGGPGLSMAYLLPDLAPLSVRRRVVHYDQRGGGRSTIPAADAQITAAKHVDDLEAVRKFFGMSQMTLVGHSWGAGLAAQYASSFPDRVSRMLLVDAMPPRQFPYEKEFGDAVVEGWGPVTAAEIERLGAAMTVAADPVAPCRAFFALYAGPYYADPRKALSSKGDSCSDPPEALRSLERAMMLTMTSLGENWDWRPALDRVQAPTLIVHGEKDPIPLASAREWAQSLPNARLLIVKDSGHFPFVEQPDVFFPAAERFLGGEWPDGVETAGAGDPISGSGKP